MAQGQSTNTFLDTPLLAAGSFICILDVIAGQIKFSGGTFDQTGSFEQNGSASGWGDGNCIFNSDVTFKNTGTAYLRLGQTNGDVYNGKVYLYSSGGYSLQMAYGDTSYFNDTIYVNSTGNGGINFANGTYGASILGDSACLVTGSTGISAGTIQFKNIVQSATSSNSITASGTVLFNVYSNSFLGKVNFTAPNLVVKSTTFGDSTSLTKTGHTLNNTWDGANVYNGVVTITNGNTSTAYVKLASQNADTYNKDVFFNAGTGAIQAANAGTNIYNGNVSVNGNNVTFNTSGGTLKFAGEQNQEFGGGTNTLTFNKLIVDKAGGNVTLNQPITIDSLLQLTSGIIYTDTIITLKATATTTGASNQSFVDGTVKKIGNTAFVFPVGDEGQWNPIEITAPSQISDAYIAEHHLNQQTYGNTKDTTIQRLNTCSYWTLTRSAGTSKVYVKLFWDSLSCGLYDTSGLGVSAWNGTKWEDLGNGGMNGNVLSGEVTSDTTSSSYIAFTWAYRTSSNVIIDITISPELNLADLTGAWNHSISEDYFGYNGANILDAGQYYSDLASDPNNSNLPVLKNNGISTIRLNGGTFGNYWDWRTGWFIPEDNLPNDWYYTRMSHKKELPNPGSGNPFVNDMSLFKISSDIVGARPIFQLNSLTSSFNYEVASLYRAGELNLPVRYIELGNEFYLGDEQYKDKFPSSLDYIKYATEFTNDLKLIAPFSNTQVAVIGASTPNGIPGRRALWLDVILENINKYPTHRPDAITIHEYYASGLKDPIATTPLAFSTIGKMLQKPFSRRDDMFADELNDIALTNSQLNLNPPLEVWLTEYNLDESEGNNVGTWAHGLFNAIQTLTYLESPLITHISSHAMTSNAVFGNIFENEFGFEAMTSGQLPTNVNSIGPSNFDTDKYGFTASGAALNEIALALKGQNVIAHRIDFDNLLVQKIQYFNSINNNWVTTDYLDLYGWCFEKEGGTEAIILNLGPNQYQYHAFDQVGWYNGSTVSFETMVQLTASDQTNGNGGVLPLGSIPPFAINDPLFTTNEINISLTDPLILPGYSLTRLIYRDPSILSIRLTDDEICEGSETSVIIAGMPFGSTCSLSITNSSSQSILHTTSDSVFVISGLAEEVYTITATAGTASSPITPPTILTVHAPIAVTITTTPNSFNPCSTSTVTLNANLTMTSGSDVNDYCYLWVPDKNIIGGNPFDDEIDVNLTDLTTEAYQVYVYNEECWASSAPKVIERSPINVDLGKDFTTCTSADFTLNPQVIQSPYSSEQNLLFKLTGDNAPTNVQSTPEFNISGLSAGLHTYTIEVWLDDGGSTFSGCPATTDEIIVNVVNCCSCSSNVVTLLPISHEEYTTYGHPRETYIDETEFIDAAIRSSYFGTSIASGNGIKQTVTITGNNNTYSTFCINGELWLRSEIFDVNQRLEKLVLQKCTLKLGPDAKIRIRGKVTLVLEGCIIEKCDGSTELWDGIYADIEDEATTEPEIVIDQYGSQPTQIKDGKNAIVIKHDSPYKIQHCDFYNNYIDIKIEKGKKITQQGLTGTGTNATYTNNYIRSSTFSSSANTLLSPYNTVYKFAGITLNDVELAVIGDSSLNVLVSENVFSNSNYGIHSNNSSFDCYHSTFSDITNFGGAPLGRPIKGVCIYSSSNSDYNDRSMNVGVTTADASIKNYFLKSNYGVLSYGEMNARIFNNDFGDLDDIDNRISNTGIFTVNSGSKKVYISRNNNFYYYNVGIRAIGLNSFGEYHIGYNYFSYTMSIPNNPLNFEGTGIWVGNSYYLKNTNTPPNLQIFENDFGSLLDLAGQPRIGIFVSLANTPIVQNNRIYFDHSSAPSVPTIGIWMQNTERAFINENDIINTATSSTLTNLFLGIRSDRNLTPCISENTINYLGNSMQFLGDHGQVSLSQNKMHFYDNAISLIGADIGVQGFFDISNNDSRSDENEFHHTNTGLQPDRVIGSVGNTNLPLSWYFNSSNNQIENPDINNSISQAFLAEQGVAPTLEAIECPLITDPVARNMAFGSVIGDSTRYDENYYDFFYQNSRANLYSILKADISLLNMEDEADSSFEAFYNTMNASNIEKFDSIRSQIVIGDYNSALQILNTINDTINFESVLKNVLGICLNLSIVDSSLTSNDSTIFYEIANENQLLYGEASIVTRNWLFYEVHDGALSQESRIANSNEKIETKFEVTIFPNPTTENLFLKYKEIVPQQIKVLDINQRVILNSNNINYLILKNIDAGVYFVQFIKNGRILRTHKIVKL